MSSSVEQAGKALPSGALYLPDLVPGLLHQQMSPVATAGWGRGVGAGAEG